MSGNPDDPTVSGGGGGGVTPGAGGVSSGASGMQTRLAGSVRLKRSGVVLVIGAALMSFSSGNRAWRFEVWIDDQLVWDPDGSAPLDCCFLGGILYCAVDPAANPDGRDVPYLVKWKAADSTVTLKRRFMVGLGLNNVSG